MMFEKILSALLFNSHESSFFTPPTTTVFTPVNDHTVLRTPEHRNTGVGSVSFLRPTSTRYQNLTDVPIIVLGGVGHSLVQACRTMMCRLQRPVAQQCNIVVRMVVSAKVGSADLRSCCTANSMTALVHVNDTKLKATMGPVTACDLAINNHFFLPPATFELGHLR